MLAQHVLRGLHVVSDVVGGSLVVMFGNVSLRHLLICFQQPAYHLLFLYEPVMLQGLLCI